MNLAPYSGMKPLDTLSDPRRQRLLEQASQHVLAHRFSLNAEEESEYYIYLMDGAVKVVSAEGREEFNATSARAKRPIFKGSNLTDTAETQAESKIIKVSRRQYALLREEQAEGDGGYEVNDVGAVDLEADVLKRLFDDYQQDRIPVPSMPEAAVKVRRLMEDPDVSIPDLARIIEQDPAMAGKLVAASNSALTGGQQTIGGVKDALVRLGLKPSCTLITSLAMKELFEFSDQKLQAVATEVWRHSLRVAATARVLSSIGSSDIDADQAFLCGLLHDIGAVTLLAYFTEHRPDADDFMVGGSLRELSAMVSGMVLQKWTMGAEFIQAAEGAGKWADGGDSPCADLINLAKQQVCRIHHPDIDVPDIAEIAAYRSLAPRGAIEGGVIAGLADHPGIASALEGLGY